jgi:hypothetical protein
MKSIKYRIDMRQQEGVYNILCSWRKCYIREIGHSFQVKIKENNTDIQNKCIQTLSLANHSLNIYHHI